MLNNHLITKGDLTIKAVFVQSRFDFSVKRLTKDTSIFDLAWLYCAASPEYYYVDAKSTLCIDYVL